MYLFLNKNIIKNNNIKYVFINLYETVSVGNQFLCQILDTDKVSQRNYLQNRFKTGSFFFY